MVEDSAAQGSELLFAYNFAERRSLVMKTQDVWRYGFLGFGLVWPCFSLASGLLGSAQAGAQEVLSSSFMFPFGSIISAILIAFVGDRVFPLSKRRSLAVLVAGVAITACFAIWLLGDVREPSLLFFSCVLYFVLGAALAYFNCAWLELYSRLPPYDAALYLCLSHFLTALCGFIPILLLSFLMERMLVVIALIFATVYLYCRCCIWIDSGCLARGERVEREWSFPVKPVVLVALFASASVIPRVGISGDYSNYARLGVVAISVALFVLFKVQRSRVKLEYIIEISLWCMIAALLCRILGFAWTSMAAMLFANIGYAIFYIITYLMLCRLSFRFGVNPLLLFGSTFAAIRGAQWLAGVVGNWSYAVSENAFLLLCAVALLVLLAGFLASMGLRSNVETWGMKPKDRENDIANKLPLEVLSDTCARIARAHNLTRREEEMLLFLAQGSTFADIESALTISHATVKSHVQHTYEKCGVHSKSDLVAFVKSYDG